MKSKTIILSNEKDSGRGILTLSQDADRLQCKLRLYNIKPLNENIRLGLYHNKDVYIANVLDRGGYYESSFAGTFDMNENFYTAIIDTKSNNEVLLSGGTYAGYFYQDNSIFSNLDDNKNHEQELPSNEVLQGENEDELNTNFPEHDCAHCKYKEYFYSDKESQSFLDSVNISNDKESLNQEINDNIPSPNQKCDDITTPPNLEDKTISILDSIIPQFKYIFDNYPLNEELNSLLKNARFVKIKENDDEYSIGVIYDNDVIRYICYALRCNYNSPAPEELGKHYQWLPIDDMDPLSEGYYIVYQDASDLKIIEI